MYLFHVNFEVWATAIKVNCIDLTFNAKLKYHTWNSGFRVTRRSLEDITKNQNPCKLKICQLICKGEKQLITKQ